MKKIIAGFFIGIVAFGASSCKKYFDINANPNNATSATPELILPQAIAYTASVVSSYNSYGAETGLYAANAGGYGGFGEAITYNYVGTGGGLWPASYDNLEDYQAILNKTNGVPVYDYFNGVARIMKAYNFQLLVDAFNDVPYFDALKGADNLSPVYTPAKDIYKDLASELDKAIATIDSGNNVVGVTPLGASDIVFKGDVTMWKQFANTLKLRILIRGNGKVDFANKTFSDDGFLSADALINPGYTRDNGKQSPLWNSWAFTSTGGDPNKAWEPSQFIFGFYDGHSITDSARGRAIYYKFPNTGVNRLGIESVNLVASPSGTFWYPATIRIAGNAGDTTGVLKGPDAGMPILLASESNFLQAEGLLEGLITEPGTVDSLFNVGVLNAFTYTFEKPDGTIDTKKVIMADTVAAYKAQNASNYLVNIALASSPTKKLEAIITQKFIALNFINSQEGWNEYRRTHYPTINPSGTGYQTFASSVSESTRPDKLPTRILYPADEGTYNGVNQPKGIQPFSSLIFWAL